MGTGLGGHGGSQGSSGGQGGVASSSSGSQSASASTSSSSSSSSASSSSSGEPSCGMGGDPCVGFADCCSGTCAGNVCTQCATTGDKCGQGGCCIGDTCYFGVCHNCKDDGNPCQTSGDCCSTVCSQGACAQLDCGPLLSCGSYCVDSANDENNCGSCGHACGFTQSCCGGVCADLSSDDNHCGVCDNTCGPSDDCASGTCLLSLCCEEDVNVGSSELPSVYFDRHMAWPIVPQCSILLSGIDVFTTQGWLYLLSDSQGEPGATLFKNGVPVAPAPQWAHVPVNPPIQLAKGTTYWLSHFSSASASTRSVANQGVMIPFKTAFGGFPPANPVGPWSDGGSTHIMFKLIGKCP